MKKYILYILIGIISILQSCNIGSTKNSTDCSTKIVFQLNWVNDPTFTGEYLAFEKYWKAKKLEVTIKQGGIGIDPIAMVASKSADYAVVGADKALIAASSGAPIRIISVDFQRNPVGWIVRPSLNINSFEDVSGRDDIILGDKSGTEVSSILNLIISRKEIDIKPQSVGFDFSYFITNKNSIYPVYLNEEPVRAKLLHNLDIVELDPIKEENGGIKLYGNVIITHKEKIDSCKNQVDCIIEGITSGWKFAQTNVDESVNIVNKYVQTDEEYVKQVIKRTLNYVTVHNEHSVPPGHMEFSSWEETYNTLVEANLIDKNLDLKSLLYFK